MKDTLNIETISEELIARAQTTQDMVGSQLRTDRMILEHRELLLQHQDLLRYHQGYSSVHKTLVRLVRRVLVALSPITNGRRFWIPKLPREARTELTLLNTFMRTTKR